MSCHVCLCLFVYPETTPTASPTKRLDLPSRALCRVTSVCVLERVIELYGGV